MYKSLIVVDNFMQKPEVLRDLALKAEYSDYHPDARYAGRNSKYPQIIGDLDAALSNIAGEPLKSIDPKGTSQAKFRLTLEGDQGQGGVHIDHCEWTAIIYLSLPEHCKGGTEFFRHLRTDTDRAPVTNRDIANSDYASMDDALEDILGRDGHNPDKWERISMVPMRYNRLVLFRPWQWHNATEGFGTSVENGRLIYTMFLNNPNGLTADL